MGGLSQASENGNTKKPYVLAAIMLAMFMSAVEATIVSTAMPNIAADLGNFSLYSWVFSSYLLMQTATVLIYGKLSDLFGRKPVFTVGVIIFLIGSILCGLATSMNMLIIFRFIQGIGAGSVMTIASTIVGDMYTKEQRSQIQGYLSSVWGISAVLGPALGALFVQYLDWAFVFWMNIPIGILSIIGVNLFLHENIERKPHKMDFSGAILLVIAISSLMLLLVEGGVKWSWFSTPIISLALLFIIGAFLFWINEKRAQEPMMPFDMWKYRAITVSNIASFTTGMILMGVSSFLPTYVQGVLEFSPLIAGLTLTTMSIGWPIAATIAGKQILRIGYQKTSIFGGIALIIGAIFFLLLSPKLGAIWAACGSFFIGAGMGMTTTSFTVSVQSTVGWKIRGIATASNNFMRMLGSAVGVAFFGGILNSQLHSFLAKSPIDGKVSIDSTNILLNIEQRNSLSASVREILQDGLTYALHNVYLWVFIITIVTFILVFFMPVSDENNEA